MANTDHEPGQHNMADYQQARRDFTWQVADDYNFALDTIGQWAEDPEKLAMLWIGQDGAEERYTFVHFDEQSSRAAHAFEQLGVRKGDRVLLMLPRVVEWWETMLGLMKLGAVGIPCTTLLTPKDIQYRAEIAEAVAFVTDVSGIEKLRRCAAPARRCTWSSRSASRAGLPRGLRRLPSHCGCGGADMGRPAHQASDPA